MPHRALDLVLLEPDAVDTTLVRQCPQRAEAAYTFRCATAARVFLRMQQESTPDIVLVALSLTEISAHSMIVDLRGRLPEVPLILGTGADDDAEIADPRWRYGLCLEGSTGPIADNGTPQSNQPHAQPTS